MFHKTLILTCVSLLIAGSQAEEIKCEHQHKGGPTKFPPNFKFGVATAAYQIEGAWAEDGKTPSVWDTHTHDFPHMIDDESNGDVAADSYHRFDQDLEALKELGVNFYRFSISWPRILPWGDVTKLNPKGIEYYNMVINKLIEAGITPMVTMFHYDMPDNLAKLGGFTNPVFIEYFLNYADVLFKFFGDRVKIWGTFNEPFDYCYPGYGMGYYPPMVYAPGVGDYMCGEITIKAHARAYRLYKAKYFKSQQGKVGITLSSLFYLSRTNNQDDVDRAAQFSLGWLANPIYGKDGNYPNVMLESVIRNSFQEGQTWSRLRPISEEWKKIIKGSADFIGLNYYTSRYVKPLTAPEGPIPSWNHDLYMNMEQDPAWKVAKSVWLSCVPQGFEDILNWITKQYDGVEIIITENGWSTGDVFEDDDRIEYLRAHLHAVLNAINNGANITAYTYWSLMDNFEWQRGYTEKFGLYYVNRTSPNFERIPRKSVPYYREVIETHRIP